MRRWLPTLPDQGSITAIDTGPARSVSFVTKIDVTGNPAGDLPESAYRRLVSYFIVSKLCGEALRDACDSLVENFVYSIRTPSVLEANVDETFDIAGGVTFVDGDQITLAD